MRLDETKLRAYLDGELTVEERATVEKALADSPQAQATLAQLRQQANQVQQTLESLAAGPEVHSPAGLALKHLKAHLAIPEAATPISLNGPAPKSSAVVWESPSLLAEIKATFTNFLCTRRQFMGTNIFQWKFVWLITMSLAIALGAGLIVFGPTLGRQLVEQTSHIALPEAMLAPQLTPATELFPADSQLLANVVPLSAVFNDEIELVGYKLDQQPAQDTLNLTLYWHGLRSIKADYMVFVHLADANDNLLIGVDRPPTEGANPIQNWHSTEIIIDRYELALPKALTGLHKLIVGLYKNDTGQRLPVSSPGNLTQDNSLLLAQLQLGQATPPQLTSSAKLELPFGYGIQADPLGDSEANIAHLKELGLGWVKFQMPWKAVEASQGSYDWEMWDAVIAAYAANNIQVMLSIPKAPDWARPSDDDKSIEGPPADPAKYAEFVARVADRYRSQVQAIEVWNEQNLWYEAGGQGRINAANYVQLLQLAYQAIKSVNQDMVVISGAPTPAGNVGDLAVDDVEYLKQMYANGAKGYFDLLGAHPAGYNCPALADWRSVTPEEASANPDSGMLSDRHHSWCFLGTMEAYREVMLTNDDAGTAIAITEFGWAAAPKPNQGYEYASDNTPAEQAKWIVEAYQWGKQQGWVGPMFLFNLDYGVTIPEAEIAYFGILNTPAYEAIATMPK
jgi:hypothetical protein